MKTKEFIEMLQKADPSGEGYIRLPGSGVPYYAEVKEGYWDGPYQYLEKLKPDSEYVGDKILVTTTKGYKVDIGTYEINSIVWDCDGDLERIKRRIRFDFGNYSIAAQRSEKEDRYWKQIEEEAAYARSFHEKSLEEWTTRTIGEYFDEGYEVRQPLDKPIGYYNCMTAHGFGLFGLTNKKKGLCQGECMAIIQSGKFYPEKQEEYYVWKYDPEKGKNWSIERF